MDFNDHTAFFFFNTEIMREILKEQWRTEADKNLYLLHDRNQVSIDSIDHSGRGKKKKVILGFSILIAVSFAEMICQEGLKEISI